jgi:Prolyl oligopeptidase family
MLMYGSEGLEIAERYNEWGVTAFVLTHRLAPRMGTTRAYSMANAPYNWCDLVHASFSSIPPRPAHRLLRRLGFGPPCRCGGSPGDPNAIDLVDRSRPDYLGLVYGPGRIAPGESLKNFPPAFLLCGQADTSNAVDSAQLFAELTRAGVTAEIHVYQKGRHGFGGGFATPIYSDWMARLQRFFGRRTDDSSGQPAEGLERWTWRLCLRAGGVLPHG